VLGLGESGLAMARWCARAGARVTVWDSRDAPPQLAALREHLRARGGNYGTAFSERTLLRFAVNQDMVQPAAALKAGDEVAFFPPVTGG